MRTIRTILTVPGSVEHMVLNARKWGADLLAFDLEDGVPAEEKDDARRLVCAALQPGDAVRINTLGTPRGWQDFDAVASRGATVILPKVEALIPDLRAAVGGVILVFESVVGVQRADEILRSSVAEQVRGVIFGWADFCADARVSPRGQAPLIAHAACQVVLAAKRNRVPVYCGPNLDIPGRTYDLMHDLPATWARACGFDGQVCLHPDQIGEVAGWFNRSAELSWAEEADNFRFGPPFEKLADRLRESA